MANAANSGGCPHHINLARVYRGGERQTEILIRGLSRHVPRQRLIVRRGTPLHTRLLDVGGIEVVPVDGRLEALKATQGATLLHAHETRGAQVACLRHSFSTTPYLITRRVDNRPRRDPFTRYMYRRAATVIVLSRAIGAILADTEPRAIIERIPSVATGFDSDAEWVRRFRKTLGGKFIVGQIGALDDSHKGQLTLIEAARELAHRAPDIHFVVVGDGKDSETIRAAAADLPNLSFSGWIDNVGDYLASFDVLAMPSRREGLGSILLDAMQFGLPVVASAVGGITDIVKEGRTGLLVPAGDTASLADGIERLHADRDLRESMATAARERAQSYRPELMIERYWALYRKIVPALAQETR